MKCEIREQENSGGCNKLRKKKKDNGLTADFSFAKVIREQKQKSQISL